MKEMKKLYCVEIKVYVMASTPYDAVRIAVKNCGTEDAEARRVDSVANEWYGAIPFNADEELTCGEILKMQREGKP